MNTNYLKKLEFDKILQNLSEYCHTYIGREKALSLEPSSDKEFVKKILSETSQAVSLIDRNSTPPLSEIEDIRVYIKMLESSNTLTAKALLDICNILENVIKDSLEVLVCSWVISIFLGVSSLGSVHSFLW